MKNIGQRIKELRRKKDLTQEKLADFLGVTYQSVSKWETGITYPDLSLIVPIARVLGVSTDELLGVVPAEKDERKAYFDAEYVEFWKKENHEADYLIAKQAVEEYPGEYRYWHWLADIEYYISFNKESQEEFIAMNDSSVKHNLMVYENTTDENLKDNALWTIICAYRYSGRVEEARKYVELYPERRAMGRDDALDMCLEGEELLYHRQRTLGNELGVFCYRLEQVWSFGDVKDPRVRACVQAEKTIIETIIADGNFIGFNGTLSRIHQKLAEIAIADNDPDTAVKELETALKYEIMDEKVDRGGKQYYTCLILDHYDYEYTDSRYFSYVDQFKENLREYKIYDPLRDREDFKSLSE